MELQPIIKKYWPWMLGGVAGLYLITRISGGSSGGTVTVGTDPATAQLAMQAEQLRQQNQLALMSVANTSAKQNNDAQVQNILAQGAMAGQLGAASAQLVTALNIPAITAINSANDLNKQAINTAGAIAIGGYTAQAVQMQAAADAAGSYAGSMAVMQLAVANATKSANDAIVGQQNALRPGAPAPDTSGQKWQAAASVLGAGIAAFSDENVKLNIQPATDDSVALISQLEFVSFDYDTSKIPAQPVDSFTVGVLAQQAREVKSHWVVEDKATGYLMLNLPAMMMDALHAVKQLAAEVAQLKAAQ